MFYGAANLNQAERKFRQKNGIFEIKCEYPWKQRFY